MDRHDNPAEQLVDRIQRALVAGRRDVALILALDVIAGNRPATDDQFDAFLAKSPKDDTLKKVWSIAEGIFKGQPARWRSLIGKLIKVAGSKRALEVVEDCASTHTQDPTTYIAAASARGERSPLWRMTEEELCDACAEFSIKTQGESRKDLEAELQAARKRAEDRTCHGFSGEFING